MENNKTFYNWTDVPQYNIAILVFFGLTVSMVCLAVITLILCCVLDIRDKLQRTWAKTDEALENPATFLG